MSTTLQKRFDAWRRKARREELAEALSQDEFSACYSKFGEPPEDWDGFHIGLDHETHEETHSATPGVKTLDFSTTQITWTVDPEKQKILADKGFTGSRIGQINLDTGWNPHERLKEPTEKRKFTSDRGLIEDRNGHGTHTIGSNQGVGISYSPGARLDGVGKCLSDSGYGSNTVSSVRWAAEVARKHGSKLLSCSWGGGGSVGSSMTAALKECEEAGLYPIFAAGNSGFRAGRSTVIAPAISPYALAVASHTRGFDPSSFSSAGPAVAISAGGSGVRSCSHRSRTGLVDMSGTSMATPTAVSALTILLEVMDWLGMQLPVGVQGLTEFLNSNEFLRDAGSRGFDWRFGHGILHIDAIIDYCIEKLFRW